MGALDLGEGVAEVLAQPSRGRVVAVHRRAAYLRLGGRLIACVAAGVPPGPLHLRCAVLPPVRPGEAVACDGYRLAGGRWALRTDAPVWRGARPDPGELASGAASPAMATELAAAARPVADDPELPDVPELPALLLHGRLEDVADAVGGRGPGLTPAGDDLLAGLLVVAALRWGAGVRERLAAVAGRVDTTGIAAAFLAQAARGRSFAPAHDWLVAVAAGRPDAAAAARNRIVAIGASSGRYLLAGLALGVRLPPAADGAAAQLPRVESQIARAGSSSGLPH